MIVEIIEAVRRIATELAATPETWASVVVPLVALALLLAARRYLGRWPDLWRFRRAVLPHVARFGDGSTPHAFDAVDDEIKAVDLSEQVPEKTSLPLQPQEYVGVVDAAPSVVRDELRSMDRVYPNNLASIQYDIVDDERVFEVGSYALRPEGFVGVWQTYVRLTPTQDGRTRLWAHRERNAWRQPVRHYRAEGWSSDEGVREVASWFASDERFEASDRAVELLGSE